MNNQAITKYVANKIRKRRELMGLTQEELAKIIKLSRVSIVNLEAGRQMIAYDKLLILCGVFECTPNDLLPKPPKCHVSKSFKILWK